MAISLGGEFHLVVKHVIELELPPKINKLITTAYNTSINLLLY